MHMWAFCDMSWHAWGCAYPAGTAMSALISPGLLQTETVHNYKIIPINTPNIVC